MFRFIELIHAVLTYDSVLLVRILAFVTVVFLHVCLIGFTGVRINISVVALSLFMNAIGCVLYVYDVSEYGIALIAFFVPFLLYYLICMCIKFCIRIIFKLKNKNSKYKINFKTFKYGWILMVGVILSFLWLILSLFDFTAFYSMNLQYTVGQIVVVCIYFVLFTFVGVFYPLIILHYGNNLKRLNIFNIMVGVIWTISSMIIIVFSLFNESNLFNFFAKSGFEKLYLVFSQIPKYGREFLLIGNIVNLIGLLINSISHRRYCHE